MEMAVQEQQDREIARLENEKNDLHYAFHSDCHEEPGKKKMYSSFTITFRIS